MPTDPLPIAIAAQESARSAHHRLDRMNGSIDRLTVEVAKANAKSDQILIRLAREDGGEAANLAQRTSGIDSRRFLVTSLLIFLSSSAGAGIVALFFHRH